MGFHGCSCDKTAGKHLTLGGVGPGQRWRQPRPGSSAKPPCATSGCRPLPWRTRPLLQAPQRQPVHMCFLRQCLTVDYLDVTFHLEKFLLLPMLTCCDVLAKTCLQQCIGQFACRLKRLVSSTYLTCEDVWLHTIAPHVQFWNLLKSSYNAQTFWLGINLIAFGW